MNNIIFVRVATEKIAYVNWIMQGFGHLSTGNTIDADKVLMLFYPTLYTLIQILDIIKNLPFEEEIFETSFGE